MNQSDDLRDGKTVCSKRLPAHIPPVLPLRKPNSNPQATQAALRRLSKKAGLRFYFVAWLGFFFGWFGWESLNPFAFVVGEAACAIGTLGFLFSLFRDD